MKRSELWGCIDVEKMSSSCCGRLPIDLKRENLEIDSVNLALPYRLTATIFSCKLIQYFCIDVGR